MAFTKDDFIWACETNELRLLKNILSDTDNDTNIDTGILDKGFNTALYRNRHEIVKYLLFLPKFNIDFNRKLSLSTYIGFTSFHHHRKFGRKFGDALFGWACEYGHLDVVKYMLSLENFYIDTDLSYTIANDGANTVIYASFSLACKNNHLDIVKHILSLQKHKICLEIGYDTAFDKACLNDHVDIIKYLILNCNIDIKKNDDYVYRIVCGYNCLEIIKYLSTIDERYVYKIVNNKLISWDILKIYKHKEIDKNIELCPICMEQNSDMISDCCHQLCIKCLEKLKENKCVICRNNVKEYFKIKN